MARKADDLPVTRKYLAQALGALEQGLEQRLEQKLDQKLGSAIGAFRTEIKADISRLAVEMDRRFAMTASQASMDSLTAKVDRFIAAMDRTSGEQLDNRRTLIVYDSVLGEHRRSLDTHERRISAIESRLPPSAP